MVFYNPYESDISKASKLQRWILVMSYIYYEKDSNVVSDKVFDENARQLVRMQRRIDINKTDYGYAFYDFDASTGFYLFDRLTKNDKEKIKRISEFVLNLYNTLDKKRKV